MFSRIGKRNYLSSTFVPKYWREQTSYQVLMFSSEILAPATFQANCILPKCFPMSASLGGLTSNIYFLVGKIPLFGIFLKKYFVAKPYFSLGYQMSQLEQNIDDFADPQFSFWHNTLLGLDFL